MVKLTPEGEAYFKANAPKTLDEYVKQMRAFYEDAPKSICNTQYDKTGKEFHPQNNDTMAEIAKIQAIPNIFQKVIYPLWDFLNNIQKWERQELLDQLREFSKEKEIKFKQLAWILRIILQGQSIAPDLFFFMEIFEKQDCLHRLTFFMDEFAHADDDSKNFTFFVRYRTENTKSKTAHCYLWIENVASLDEAWKEAKKQVKRIPQGHLGFVLEGLHDGEKSFDVGQADGAKIFTPSYWRNNHNKQKRVKMGMEVPLKEKLPLNNPPLDFIYQNES